MSGRTRIRALLAIAAVVAAVALYFWLRSEPQSDSRGAEAPSQRLRAPDQPSSIRARRPHPLPQEPADLRLEGRVIDLADKAVEAAEVRLASRTVSATALSDSAGGFAFDALPPGVYFVDAATDEAACNPKRVHLTEDTPPVLLRLSPAIRAQVTVLSSVDHEPVQGAAVEVLARHGDTPYRSSETDERGIATLLGMPPDGYAVTVSATGFRTRVEPFPPKAGLRWSMTVVLTPGVEVRGRVIDEDGAPVAAAAITPMPTRVALFVTAPKLASHSTITDGHGEFALILDSGSFRLLATHSRYLPGQSDSFFVDGKTPVQGIEIRLDRGGSIAGRVVTKDGRPVAHATVRSSASSRRDLGTGMRETLAAADGSFLIEGLPRVAIDLVARSPSASSDDVQVDLSAASSVEDVIVTLELDGVIAGMVTGSDGKPIEDAQVFCVGLPHGAVGTRPVFPETTDPAGHFACRGLVPGDYSLTATRPYPNNNQGPAMRSVTLQGVESGTTDVVLVLPEDGTLVGQVVLANGSTPKSFGVAVDAGGGPRIFENAKDGRFVLDGLAPRTYNVRVTAEGCIPRIVPNVEVPEGGRVEIGPVTLAPAMPPPQP